MPQLQTLALFVLSAIQLQAETVLWTASGTLGTGTGLFQRQDLPPGAPLQIRVTYDDQAVQQVRSQIFGQTTSDYRTNIQLNITITSGDHTWEGFVDSADSPPLPTTFLTITSTPSPNLNFIDQIQIDLSSEDNGTFPSFPFRLGDSTASFELDLIGNNNTFLDFGISPDDFNLSELGAFTGCIATGVGNALPFTLDPASLVVIFEADESIDPFSPPLSLTTTGSWNSIDNRFGTDATITRTYPRTEEKLFYRVVTLPRPTS